ncbi:hypothetical protein [Bradyrhizobium sp.]|uniref:hypothetical protein n=1 Tax=Bradyrhizobium sp. TaxID=376 RepID=UPI003C3B3367
MSLLGFDALGRWALGQTPNSGNFVLIANGGAFALTGLADKFSVGEAASVGAFALGGIAAAFSVSAVASAGALALAGVAAAFHVSEAEAAGGVVVVLGIATVDLIGHPSPPPGGFAATAVPAGFVVTIAPHPGSYTLSGFAAGFARDYVNWAQQDFAGASWSGEGAPAPAWSAANSQPSSWHDQSAAQPNWTEVAPPSNTPPSNVWTVDPAQAIPPPVSQ